VVCAALLVSSHGALADFVQQGPKLLGTVEVASQGSSVALSADGNTAIVGGPNFCRCWNGGKQLDGVIRYIGKGWPHPAQDQPQ
jgi:hypothetical protein